MGESFRGKILKRFVFIFEFRKNAPLAKSCISIVTAGVKAVSNTSTEEHEELLFLALSILERLDKSKLLKCGELEMEKMWFNFARKVWVSGKSKRSHAFSKHVVLMLAQNNTFQHYIPDENVSSSRAHLSACAFLCYCGSLSPQSLLSDDDGAWKITTAWIDRVESDRRKSLKEEQGRVLAAALKGPLPSQVLESSMVKSNHWCRATILASSSDKLVQLEETFETLLALLASKPAETVGPDSEPIILMLAKRMEDLRKVLTKANAVPTLSIYVRLLQAVIQAVPAKYDRLIPYAVEAASSAATIAAVQSKDVARGTQLLQDSAKVFSWKVIGPKVFNVGVALYSQKRFDDACAFLEMYNIGLQREYSETKRFPEHFYERHRVWACALEQCSKLVDALVASFWAYQACPDMGAAKVVAHYWRLCEKGSLVEDASKALDAVPSEAPVCYLIRACNLWKPLSNTDGFLSRLIPRHKRPEVERARLLLASEKTDEAMQCLKSISDQDGHVLFWLGVAELESNRLNESVVLFTRTLNWIESLESLQDLDDELLVEGLVDVLQWTERFSLAIRAAECGVGLANTPEKKLKAKSELLRLQLVSGSVAASDLEIEDGFETILSGLEVILAVQGGESTIEATVSNSGLWSKARWEYLLALSQEKVCNYEEAFQSAMSSVKASLVAMKSECTENISPWRQLLYYFDSSFLCGSLYEMRGLVQEAEYLWNRAKEIASVSRELYIHAFLCFSSCKKRDIANAKGMLSSMRSAAKLAQSVEDYKVAMSVYKEASGDFHLSQWKQSDPDQNLADEAYKRYKQAVALSTRRRNLVRVKQALALVRLGRRADAISMWQDVSKGGCAKAKSLSQYYLAMFGESDQSLSKSLLLSALEEGGLDLMSARNATLELALLEENVGRRFELISNVSMDKVASLPKNWTVVSLMAVERAGVQVGILVTRLDGRSAKEPEIRYFDLKAGTIASVKDRFKMIIQHSDETTRRAAATTAEKKAWWKDRMALDDELKSLMFEIESKWFGSSRDLLRPCSDDWSEKNVLEALKAAAKSAGIKRRISWSKLNMPWLCRIAGTCPFFTDGDVCEALKQCGEGVLEKIECDKLGSFFSAAVCKMGVSERVENAPLILVVGKGLECIPWESMPVLRQCAVSRMPDFSFLEGADDTMNVNSKKGFYILNPSSDLVNTQNRFESLFRERGWNGTAGKPPTQDEFLKALEECDIFVYCGHNSGEQYLRRDVMERSLKHIQPVSLLMGCSSAALHDFGHYASSGVVLTYCNAHCPAVVGNMWDVTDSDIDRYLNSVLQEWLSGNTSGDLPQAIADARNDCKLQYLVGAAPVVYGLPRRTKFE